MSEFPEEFSEEFESEEEDEEEIPEELVDALVGMLGQVRKADQDAVNDDRERWLAAYGFPHECSCATDVESGKTVTIPECYAGAAQEAFDNLRRVRAFLYALVTSPSEDPELYKRLAAEGFYGAEVA